MASIPLAKESAMNTRDATVDRDQTIARARAIRAEHASAAAFYANCRRLGELIRSDREAA
jgi:hypothetical protein